MASRRSERRPALRAVIVAAAAAVVGLVAIDCGTVVPRQGWSGRWGPLVPHRTFPADCGLCHVPESWSRLREDFAYDHEKETGYRLEGAHAAAACLRCHNDRGPVSAYTARGCGGCHPDPHQDRLGLDCSRCHDQATWRPGGLIAEHARTRFPLFGAHAAVPCLLCHERARAGDYRGAPTECDLCHADDLARATTPDHRGSGWTRDCQRCHTPSDWTRSGFSHSFFPLAQGHGGLDCIRCHTSGTFGPIPSDCFSCHQDDYARAPNHAAFGTDCIRCHTTSGWTGASIRHDFFPLTGGHSGLDCIRCHTSGTVGPIPSDCFSCHQDDYARAPDHASLGFPHSCTQCHTTASWASSFSHRFSLRGPHAVSCASCHAGGVTAFDCLGCHEHSQSRMDDEHRERPGYSYSSDACYRCHPTGRE